MFTTCRFVILLSMIGFFLSQSVPAAYSYESEDAVLYHSAIDSYRQKDYPGAAEKMELILKKFPDTPLRDAALFWHAQAKYRAGDHEEAARQMALFCREYPDSPLSETADDHLLLLAVAYELKGRLPTSAEMAEAVEKQAIEEKEAAGKAAAERAHSLALESSGAPVAGRGESDSERVARSEAAAARIERVREVLKKKAEEKRLSPGMTR